MGSAARQQEYGSRNVLSEAGKLRRGDRSFRGSGTIAAGSGPAVSQAGRDLGEKERFASGGGRLPQISRVVPHGARRQQDSQAHRGARTANRARGGAGQV